MKTKRPSKRNSLKENKKFPYKRLSSRRKELNPDGSNTGLAETQNDMEEDVKLEHKSKFADNHAEKHLFVECDVIAREDMRKRKERILANLEGAGARG